MHRLYAPLVGSRVYHSFLKHRVWVARAIPKAHILYCFPLGSLYVLWVALPLALGSLATALSRSAIAPSAPFDLWLSVFVALYHLVALPIVLRIYMDMFCGYYTGLFYVFGNTRMSETFVKETTGELEEWEAQYV